MDVLDQPPKMLNAMSRKERRAPLQTAFNTDAQRLGFLPIRIPVRIMEVKNLLHVQVGAHRATFPLIIKTTNQPIRISPDGTQYPFTIEPYLYNLEESNIYLPKTEFFVSMRSLGDALDIEAAEHYIPLRIGEAWINVSLYTEGVHVQSEGGV